MREIEVGPVESLPPGEVRGAGRYAVGNANGDLFAVTRTCRHLYADLAKGTVDSKGCLVCPWHGSRYDVKTGRMVRSPQGWFARVPGLGRAFQALTAFLPLGRGQVTERDGKLYVR
ncbi:MAG: Rieske 2Fe-2S domain-containing protein [Actinobacteria bacterium]|nr:Rieske 2Fe-2S domain-containing protein [Actinomycetota bacterium]